MSKITTLILVLFSLAPMAFSNVQIQGYKGQVNVVADRYLALKSFRLRKVSAGKAYRLSYKVKTNNLKGCFASVYCPLDEKLQKKYKQEEYLLVLKRAGIGVGSPDTWTEVQQDFVIPKDKAIVANLRLALYNAYHKTGDISSFKDVRIQEIDRKHANFTPAILKAPITLEADGKFKFDKYNIHLQEALTYHISYEIKKSISGKSSSKSNMSIQLFKFNEEQHAKNSRNNDKKDKKSHLMEVLPKELKGDKVKSHGKWTKVQGTLSLKGLYASELYQLYIYNSYAPKGSTLELRNFNISLKR
jgi:hypothetical protein